MYFNSVKKIYRLRKETNRLLSKGTFLIQLKKKKSRLRKEINRLLSKEMFLIQLIKK